MSGVRDGNKTITATDLQHESHNSLSVANCKLRDGNCDQRSV